MVDFQVVFPQELIQLTSVVLLQGVRPLTLDVTGLDFRSVDEVTINEIPSSSVIIVSKTRLLAQVPADLQASFILQTINVTSRKLTLSPRSQIRFRLGRTTSKVRGILRLVQLFLKILFTTPGTDIFSPRIGAAALKNIGKNFGPEQGGTIVSDFVVAVATTSRQIVAIQSRDPSVPRGERLLSAKVIAANFDNSLSALIVSVELTSQAGEVAQANVMV